MSQPHHLFNSAGEWIAFRIERYVFDVDGEWIGWLPWNDGEVVNPDGEYLGTICLTNRLLRFDDRPYRGYPGNPGYPGYPGFIGFCPLPPGAHDLALPLGKVPGTLSRPC